MSTRSPAGGGSPRQGGGVGVDVKESATEALWRPFGFPAGGPAHAFARAQVALARNEPELARYQLALQRYVRFTPPRSEHRSEHQPGHRPEHRVGGAPPVLRPALAALRAADRLLAPGAAPRAVEVDVLLCGVWVWHRPAEDELWDRILAALLEQGRTVAALVHGGSPLAVRWRRRRRRELAAGRLRLVDPRGLAGRLLERATGGSGTGLEGTRAAEDFRRVRELLADRGISLDAGARDLFAWIAGCGELWRRVAPRLTFRAALVRCHWLPLDLDVVAAARRRRVPVAALQQGVVSHSMDAPVTPHRLATFGPPSRHLLAGLDAALATAAGRHRHHPELVDAGPFLDPRPAGNGEETAGGTGVGDLGVGDLGVGDSGVGDRERVGDGAGDTVLVLDQAQPWALRYYDLEAAQAGLVAALDNLLRRRPEARVRIRVHPAAGGIAAWEGLVGSHGRRVTVSPPGRSLDDDLAAGGVAVTLFSGAGARAAAGGLPVLFHAPPDGFHPPSLAPFSPLRTGSAAELASRLEGILGSTGERRRAADDARRAADRYFENGFGGTTGSDLPALLDRLLAPLADGGPGSTAPATAPATAVDTAPDSAAEPPA